MNYDNMRVVDLKALAREHGLQHYSHLRKAALINFIRDSERRSIQPQLQRPMQPNQSQSIRFRPDWPRQLELMRRLEGISTQPRSRRGPALQRPAP